MSVRADKPLQVVALSRGRKPQEGSARPVSRWAGSDRVEERATGRYGRGRMWEGQAAGSSLLQGVLEGGVDLVVKMHNE